MGSVPDLFGPTVYDADFNVPLVDHLHPHPHSHQSLLQYLTHRKSQTETAVSQPNIDIRNTDTEYVIEVELPGVHDKNAVKLEWTSSRSLVVEGSVDRPLIADKPPDPIELAKLAKSPSGTRDSDGNWIPPSDVQPRKPTLVVGERRIGPFRRHFNFPVDLDVKALQAKLESGLLSIRIPKKRQGAATAGRINIE